MLGNAEALPATALPGDGSVGARGLALTPARAAEGLLPVAAEGFARPNPAATGRSLCSAWLRSTHAHHTCVSGARAAAGAEESNGSWNLPRRV